MSWCVVGEFQLVNNVSSDLKIDGSVKRFLSKKVNCEGSSVIVGLSSL